MKTTYIAAFNFLFWGACAFLMNKDTAFYICFSWFLAGVSVFSFFAFLNALLIDHINGQYFIPINKSYCRPLLKGLGIHGRIDHYNLQFQLTSDFWESPSGHIKIAGFGLGWNHHKNSIRISVKPMNQVDMYGCYLYYYDSNQQNNPQKIWLFDFQRPEFVDVELYINYGEDKITYIPADIKKDPISAYCQLEQKPRWGFMLRPHMQGINGKDQKAKVQHNFYITQKFS